MAKTYPSGFTGAVTLPTGHGADFNTFTLREVQQTEDVSFYGANTYNAYRGAATYHMSATVGAFAAYGASGFTPGFGAETNVGASATFTVASGVTLVGSFVVGQIELVHARPRASVALTFNLENSADTLVTTWPVT